MTRAEGTEILDFLRTKEINIYGKSAAMRAKHSEKRKPATKSPMKGENGRKSVGFESL